MPITEFQLEARKKHVGSSDTAAIMGLNPWRTAYDVWLEKTGQLDADMQPQESEAAGIGKMIEDGLLDWCYSELPVDIRANGKMLKNQYRVHAGGVLSATHDALLVGTPVGLEAKTSGIMSPATVRDNWGEAYTDEVPDYTIVQCQHQMVVSNLNVVFIPALLGGRGRVMFQVDRNQELQDGILQAVEDFWRNNVEKQVPPDNSLPSISFARARHRTEGKAIELDNELVQAWKDAVALKKEADAKADEAEAAVLAAMADAEFGDFEDGRVKMIKGRSSWLDQKGLLSARQDLSEVFAEFTKQKEYVYPRIVKKPVVK